MKLRLEATPAELNTKADALVKALANSVQFVNPDLADRLEKALPHKEPTLKYSALREIKSRMDAEYERQVAAMTKRINAVLKRSVAGSPPVESLQKAEVELPDHMGEHMWEWFEKGAGHKYIRRVPTGDPKRPWRYYYKVTGGEGVGSKSEMLVGAKFQLKHGEKAGHYEVLAVDAGKLRLRHDETGHEVTMSASELKQELQAKHSEAIFDVIHARSEELWRAKLFGTEQQVEKLRGEARKLAEMFPRMAKAWYHEPTSEIPEGAGEMYKSQLALRNALVDIQSVFSQSEQARGIGPSETVRVGKAMQAAARTAREQLQAVTGYDFLENATSDGAMEKRASVRKKLRGVLGPDAEDGLGYFGKVLREIESGEVDSRIFAIGHSHYKDWVDYTEYQLAKQDLALDAREEMTPEVAIMQGQLIAAMRSAYYREAKGSRTAFNALGDMLQSTRTQRGVAAIKQLTSPVYDKGRAGTAAIRELLGYSFGDALKRADEAAARNKELGYTKLSTAIHKPVPELAQAIAADRKAVLSLRPPEGESKGDAKHHISKVLHTIGEPVDVQAVELHGDLLGHRFNQIAPQKSAVGRLFQERFGATVFLNEETFAQLVDPTVRDQDYQEVNLRYVPSNQEKKVLAKVRPDQREKAKRYLALAKNNFGYHAGADAEAWKWANKGEKAAYNEVKAAIEVSRETKERALHALYHAFEDMEAALGTTLDLRSLPIVVSDRHVGCGANAHFMPASGRGLFDKLGGETSWQEISFKPHIAVHTGFEKSLAHELMHYLDNRTSLRVSYAEGMRWYDTAPEKYAQKLGMPEGGYGKAWLAEQKPELDTAIQKFHEGLWGGKVIGYSSNAASFFVRAESMPEFQSEASREFLDAMREGWLKTPGAKELWDLHSELRAIGAYDDYRKLDSDESSVGSAIANIVAELSGAERPTGEKAIYWQMGTEVTARIAEQYVHAKLAKQGNLNPSLTHVTYAEDSRAEKGAYINPKVFAERIAPKFEAVMRFYGENMAKALLDEAEDFLEKAAQHKYIRRIPTGKQRPKYRYIYAESSAAHAERAPVEGEKIRIKEGDKEGHYEVTASYPGDWVTLKHDESGHEVTVKRDWLNQLFLKEYAEKHAADRARLTKTYEAAKKFGSQKQVERARELLAQHMERFPEPSARAAELRAEHARTLAAETADPHKHLTAATAQLEGIAQGARDGVGALSKAKAHLDAVPAPKRRRGRAKVPKSPGEFGNKAWSYGAITEGLETSADFSRADAAYRAWKGESGKGGPKPEPWQGGELDAVNEYLEVRVSSPREAWDRLTVGVRRWDDPRVVEAMDIMREIPGYANLRLPDNVIDWLAKQAQADYERTAEKGLEDGFGEDAFDFNFGFNTEAEETRKAMPTPGAEGTYEDHSLAIAKKDEKAYKRVKVHLQRQGYKASDFERGGSLYGKSTNELIELARSKKTN